MKRPVGVEVFRCADGAQSESIEKSGVLVRNQLRVIRAFSWGALAMEGGGTPDEELKGLESVRPGEFDYLGAQWPRMEDFLRARGLSEKEAA
ncbi:hypothetical protein [Myxococcus xanthus]|uniref:hypothetical protein n=1 Tax=Myxococcus xanthus TaxID=34 RepID=UPI0020A30FE4|nr:hypothetical protein [Myxococcus xanthus]